MSAPSALIAFGKNWEVPIPESPADIQPSLDTRLTAMAAGLLYMDGAADSIVLSGGYTAGDDRPSEADAMHTVLREHFDEDDIPARAIRFDRWSYDTATNLEAVAQMRHEGMIGDVNVVTVGYHLPRVLRLAGKQGVPVSGAFRSDQVVSNSELAVPRLRGSEHYLGRLVWAEARRQSSVKPLLRATSALALEGAAHALLTIDPDGTGISRRLTQTLRHRQQEN